MKLLELDIREGARLFRLRLNKLLGLSFIPDVRQHIYIEPTSLCNLNCVFCAYGIKTSPKITVSQEKFEHRVAQASALGFRSIGLTPVTGDIFMDRGIFEKFRFLENFRPIDHYHFFTNAILLNEAKIEALLSLKKLSRISLSIYGSDEEEFCRITKGSSAQYQRLITNLRSLLRYEKHTGPKIHVINRRSRPNASNIEVKSELTEAVFNLARRHRWLEEDYDFENWGGLIKANDLAAAGLESVSRRIIKIGACTLIFSKLQIMADGTVNACACRDVNATLALGNIENTPLDFILSKSNATYMRLISDQQRGDFNSICDACDFYQSIYDSGPSMLSPLKIEGRSKIERILENM